MKVLLQLITIAFCVSAVYSCTASGLWDSTCPTATPFCVDTSKVGSPTNLQCVACRPSMGVCDCDVDEYCGNSRAGGTVGQCKKFSKAGNNCLPMTATNYANPNVTDDLKCADTTSTATTALYTDYQGVCIEKTCRICSPNSGPCSPNPSLGSEYLGPARVCVFPGTYSTIHSAPWAPGAYYENTVSVWLAVFFCLIVLTLLVSAGGVVLGLRR